MSVSSKMHHLLDKAPLRAESREDDDKKVIIKTLLAAFKKGGYDEMMTAAYTLEGHGISKQMLSSLLLGMTRTGELGGVSVRLTADEKWLIDQYAYDIREWVVPVARAIAQGAMAVAKSPAGRAALASAGEFAAKAVGRAIKQKVDAKQLSPDKYHDEHGQCPDGFRRNRAGTKCVPVGKTESSSLKADVEENAFHHGTIRQWQNGRHMKNGANWERIKTGRPQQHASKMPTVFDVVQGNVPPDALGPPIASMPSIGVVGASVPEMSVSEATLILQAQLEGEEHFDEDIMKMVFGVLRKVTGRKEPLTIKAATPSGVTPINVYQQLRKSKRTRMAER